MASTPDSFVNQQTAFDSPARKAFSITPTDGTELARPTRGLYIGGAGDVACIFEDDTSAVTLSGLTAGTLYPFAVKQVNSTNTTATNIVGVV